MADAQYRDEHQQIRPRRLRDRGRAGGSARGVLQQDPHRAGAARGRRRPSGGPRGRHLASEDLGDRVDCRRIRRACNRAALGCAQRRAVRTDLSRAEGLAGADPGRVRIDRRGRRRGAHRRRIGKTRRGLHRPARRRRNRILVPLRAGARFPPGAPRGPVRRAAHRPGLTNGHALPRSRTVQDHLRRRPAALPDPQDRIGMAILLAVVFVGVPLAAATPAIAGAIDFNYWFSGVLIPFLIFSLAALGLNILTGYAGQLSLGTAAFMAVGAFAAYNFELRVPGMPMLASFILAGVVAALIGIVFGLPSLRIKGFYLAVATLAAQFFVVWALTKFEWFSNYSSSGVISAQKIVIFGYTVDTPVKRYLLVLAMASVMALAAKNMVRSSIGRAWMAVRDMDVAAEVVGIPMMKTKLLAFAISSFYCGVAGALYAFAYLGTVEPAGFELDLSFRILFMIIVGGVGSILGSFLGAAFIVLLPIFLDLSATSIERSFGFALPSGLVSNLTLIIFGALIVFFLAVEPLGLARLWQIAKEKLRLWPFPHGATAGFPARKNWAIVDARSLPITCQSREI